MARKWLTTDDEIEAWKRSAKEGNADKDAALVRVSGRPIGEGRATRDTIAAFLREAPAEVRERAMDEAGTDDDGRPKVPFVISDDTEDRHQSIIEPEGWNLSEYRKNNPVQWAHSHDVPAVGNGVGTHLADRALMSVAVFCAADVNPYGHMIGRMVEARVLKACSVGFIPTQWAFDEERGPYAVRYLQTELIEFSICNVGSNRNALAGARSIGIDVAPALDLIGRTLDGEDLLKVARPELEDTWRALVGTKTFSVGALLETVQAERERAVAAERKAAREEIRTCTAPVIAWAAVAAELAARASPGDVARVLRAHTFAAAERTEADADQAKGEEAITARAEEEPTPVPTPEVVDQTDDQSGGLDARSAVVQNARATAADLRSAAEAALSALRGAKETS